MVTFCEINKYCQQVLKKHWPNAPICEDIRRLKYDGHGTIDLLTGGFPCQPFSNAGKKRGKEDDRFLWPEMLRVIKEFKPRWIVGENVAGIINMAQPDCWPEVGGEADSEGCSYNESGADGLLCEIIDNIEQAGYTVQAFVIPACAVNAPHRRDRIWIVANSTSDRCNLRECDREKRHIQDTSKRKTSEDKREWNGWIDRSGKAHDASKDSGCEHGTRTKVGGELTAEVSCKETAIMLERSNSDGGERANRHTNIKHVQRCGFKQHSEEQAGLYGGENDRWNKNWVEVAAEFCGMDDGLPVELDGFKLSIARHRAERLRALGNAIVPQVAMEIFRSIREVSICQNQ